MVFRDGETKKEFIRYRYSENKRIALIMKSNCHLHLKKENKLKYLRKKKGFFFNINVIRDNLTYPEKRMLANYDGAINNK